MLVSILGENVLLAALLGLVIMLYVFYSWTRQPSGIPPFPVTPLPFIGNVLSMEINTKHLFEKWRREVGDIFSLYLGRELVIVFNGFESVKEALVNRGDVFSDRSPLFLYNKALHCRGISTSSGGQWKSQRKFAMKVFREFGIGREIMEGAILEDAEHIVKYFASTQGKEKDFSDVYKITTLNVLCSVMFGRRFLYDDPMSHDICKTMDTFVEGVFATGMASIFHFLQYFPGDLAGIKKMMKTLKSLQDKFIIPEIDRHFKDFDGTADVFVSAYIKEIKDKESAGQDTTELRDELIDIITDLFIAGADSTAMSLKWIVFFLSRCPQVQEKCFQEIKENVGLTQFPKLKDKPLLPYVQATVAESQRLANIAPTGIPHCVSENTTFRGFNFPKGATVLLNMDSILMNPEIWPNPDEFHPERFLDEDGHFFVPEVFIPFSIGRRVCVGESLAKMELFLIAAALIQRFHFQGPENDPPKSVNPRMKTPNPGPYKTKAISRIEPN